MIPKFKIGEKVRTWGADAPVFSVVIDRKYQNGRFIYTLKEDETGGVFTKEEKWIRYRHLLDPQ